MTRCATSTPALDQGWRTPVATVPVARIGVWLSRGFRDFRQTFWPSLTYGLVFVLLAYLFFVGLAQLGLSALILPLAAGFLLVGPVLCFGFYEASRRLEQNGRPARLSEMIAATRGSRRQIFYLGSALLMICVFWMRMAWVIFAIFYGMRPPNLDNFVVQVVSAEQFPEFILTGTAVGAVFATAVFSISVVALPMLMDRDTGAFPAMFTSLKTVRANVPLMIAWGAVIAVLAFTGMALAFLGLAVTLPLIGHASWHAYRDLVGQAPAIGTAG